MSLRVGLAVCFRCVPSRVAIRGVASQTYKLINKHKVLGIITAPRKTTWENLSWTTMGRGPKHILHMCFKRNHGDLFSHYVTQIKFTLQPIWVQNTCSYCFSDKVERYCNMILLQVYVWSCSILHNTKILEGIDPSEGTGIPKHLNM